MSIISVNGEIDADQLGMTDMHEHIFCDVSKSYAEPPQWVKEYLKRHKISLEDGVILKNYGLLMREPCWSRCNLILSDYDDAKEELEILKEAGVKSVLDPTGIGPGRNPVALRKLSRELDMNFITGTGYYRNKFHPPEVEEMSVEQIEEKMMQEVTVGIEGTDIRAGVMGELGTSGNQIYPREKMVLIAAARVNRETNVPIMVHTEGVKETVMATLELLKENGANLEKVNICHVNDRDYWKEVMDTGAWAGMDCFGSTFNMDSRMFFWETDFQRIKDLQRAIDAGYTDKITLGNDICMKMRLHKYGGWGYDHILTNLVPYMKKEGVTDEQLNTLFVENPKNFLDTAK